MKNKTKVLFLLTVAIMLFSTVCFATDSAETLLTTTDSGEDILISSDEIEYPVSDEELGEEEVVESEQEWVDGDFYFSALDQETATIDKIIDGNAFVVGNDVTISGEIGGDLFILAKKVTIADALVYSSIFVCAEEVNIEGMAYDIYAVCTNFNLTENGSVYRDIHAVCQTAKLNGAVRRNVFLTASKIEFPENKTVIYGNLEYSSSNEVEFPEGFVYGETTFNKEEVSENSAKNIGSIILSKVLDVITFAIFTFVVALIATVLTPKFLEKLKTMKIWQIAVSFPIGLGTLIFVPIVAILLLISVIGTLLGIWSLALYFLAIGFAIVIVSMLIAQKLLIAFKLEGRMKFVLFTVLAAVVLDILTMIPYLGFVVGFVAALTGLGSIVFNLFRKA